MYDSGELRKGLRVELENTPYIIVETQFVKPGKGQAFTRLKLKNLLNGAVIDRTCKIGEKIAESDYNVNQFSPNNRNYNRNDYPYGNDHSTHCRDYFAGLLASATQPVDFVVPSASPKAATAKWSGAGLQFGYEFPKGDRFSLQLHNWKGGDIEVSSQMVVYDYFLSKNLYAGVGSGTIELKALGKTQSQRGSAVNLGWQYSFSPSFKLELGYLLLSAEASITKETK